MIQSAGTRPSGMLSASQVRIQPGLGRPVPCIVLNYPQARACSRWLVAALITMLAETYQRHSAMFAFELFQGFCDLLNLVTAKRGSKMHPVLLLGCSPSDTAHVEALRGKQRTHSNGSCKTKRSPYSCLIYMSLF